MPSDRSRQMVIISLRWFSASFRKLDHTTNPGPPCTRCTQIIKTGRPQKNILLSHIKTVSLRSSESTIKEWKINSVTAAVPLEKRPEFPLGTSKLNHFNLMILRIQSSQNMVCPTPRRPCQPLFKSNIHNRLKRSVTHTHLKLNILF